MRLRKSVLRECARLALEQRGYRVELMSGPGIVPGARLRAIKGSEERVVAVRVSLDREVGLTRRPDGSWATIPRMDEVVVVVPSNDDSDTAEVLGFAPNVIIAAFDAALAALERANPDFSRKAPIFVDVDDVGLKAKAQWQTVLPLASVPRHLPSQTGSAVGFIERVRQEFAELHGVDVGNVTVEFRIKS
jgi:hypothetical protein